MIEAQKYIDELYGKNKVRDSKPEHQYYLSIIQHLIIQNRNMEIMYKEKLKEVSNV